MKSALIPFVTLVCGTAHAGEQHGVTSGFSLVGGFFQMLASLAVVVGMILIAFHLFNRYLKGGLMKKAVPRHIRVVESRFLAPKKSLLLVEVGGEYLLLGSTGDHINLIKQIDMLENIEVVEEMPPADKPASSPADAFRFLAELLRGRLSGHGLSGKRMAP